MTLKTSFSYKLNAEQQALLAELLRCGNYRTIPVPYTVIAVETPHCNVSLYKSGKCLVQGKGAEEFVTFTLEPLVLQQASVGYEDVLNPRAIQPHMGVDESGKGDFFGPIVIAAAYVDETLIEAMRKMDVKDSKRITSDSKALDMGRDLRKLLGRRFSIVKIGPQAYNRLYTKIRSVNALLAWGHARAIENLLQIVPDCPRAISDQFGSKQQVERALMKAGKKIELEQMHRAESDLAVAAASILAREGFLRGLYDLGVQYGVKLPKGASGAVQEAARDLVRKKGPTVLLETSKCHFKTADAVLSGVGMNRGALGPEGAAVSKPVTGGFGRFRKKSAKTPE